jgi:hypothetical protein
MADKIKQRRDTQANWEAVNPILDEGELGWITDRYTAKLGDGTHGFNDLPIIHAKMDEWINVEDFGAVGDGITDDTEAFQAISDYVNAKGYGVINFGYNKVYRLGRQTFTGVKDGAAYASQPMLNFENCNLLIINGNGSTLKLNDGLHYGSFDPVTGEAYYPPEGGFTDSNYSAATGFIISIMYSKNILISNLTLDGNNENLIVGGYWGDTGIQRPGTGLYGMYISNVIINNVNSSYNGQDGAIIRGNITAEDGVGSDNIFILNSIFDYNGRQGLTLSGGKNIKFINCTFSNSGQGAIASSPGAGVDIEPSGGNFAQNISFDNCSFENNIHNGIVSDGNDAKKIIIDHCEFWQNFVNSGFAFWFTGSKHVRISNSVIHGCIARITDDAIIENCRIDDAIHPTYGQSGAEREYILENGNGIWINCTFERTAPRRLLYVVLPTKFIDCTFIYKGDYPTDGNFIGVIRNCTFINCTFQDDIPDKTKHFRYSYSGNKFFNTINLGPNVHVQGIYSGEIPSDMNTVWKSGSTRPTEPQIGQRFFDTTLGKPIWFNGTDWIDATGTIV